MSASILRALIELFAIIAKGYGSTHQSDSARNVVAVFLRQQLNKELVLKYLVDFDSFITTHHKHKLDGKKSRKRTSLNSVKVLKICVKINEELAQKEKIFVVLRLMEFIAAMEHSGQQEQEFVETVAETFNIPHSQFDNMQLLVRSNASQTINDEEFLYISGSGDIKLGLSKGFTVNGLTGRFAFLRIPEENMFFLRYFGKDDLYLNGQVLHGDRCHVFRQGATLRGSKITPIYYSDVIRRFLTADSIDGIEFRADNVSFYFKRHAKQALHQFNLVEKSGSLVGIMGGSGAGKSTLLNVLNANSNPTFGSVTINGIDIHKEREKIEGVIGYVAQDDLLIEELTVFENLYFNAKLCFSKKSKSEIIEIVDNTLSNLGLSEIRNLKVGSPLSKMISGGQRKRLNIALELIREPSVLFVDEPTSGLSSRDSENIMDLLKELTLRGKLVFVVIHQPSSDIFKMFDKLFILDQGGYPIYYGNPVESIMYFKKLVNHVNQEESECPNCGNVNPEQLFNIIESRVVDEYGKLTEHRKIAPREWNNFFNVIIGNQMEPPKDHEIVPTSTFSLPDKLTQFKVFLTRDLLAKISNRQYLLVNFLEAPALALVLSFFVKYYQAGHGQEAEYVFRESENLPQFLFISVIVALFIGLTVSAEEIIRDQKILKREKFLHLSKSSYLYSKISIMFAISAIQMFLYVLVGNAILEIQGMILPYWFALFSTTCFANLLGLNISASFNSAKVIYILIPILIIPQLLLSGVIVKFDKLYPMFASQSSVPWVGNVMASRWAYEALAVNQYKNNAYEKHFYNFDRQRKYSNWKKDYWIRELRNKLHLSKKYLQEGAPDRDRLAYNLEVIKNEFSKEQRLIGNIDFPQMEDLNVRDVSIDLLSMAESKLDQLFEYYKKEYKNAAQERENYIIGMTSDPEGRDELRMLKNNFKNESLEDFVTNKNELQVIVEYEKQLVQKSDPIYLTPKLGGFFDAHYYAPSKNLLGAQITTYSANMLVLWGMTVMLMILLFIDGLRRLFEYAGSSWKSISLKSSPSYKEAEFAS